MRDGAQNDFIRLHKEARRLQTDDQILRRDDFRRSFTDTRAVAHGPHADLPCAKILRHRYFDIRFAVFIRLQTGNPQRRVRKIGADGRFDHTAGLIRRLIHFRNIHGGSKRHRIHGPAHPVGGLRLRHLRRRRRHGHLSPRHLRLHRLRRTCARIHHHAAIKIGGRRERHVFHVGQILAEHADLPHEDIAWFHQLMHRPTVEQTALQMMMATPLPEELADVADI